MKSEKVIAYVDGFNLYFGLKDKGWRCYYWLNTKSLCQKLLKPNQHLILVKYFTSRIKNPEDKRKRQARYLDALNTVDGIRPFYGKYQETPVECWNCGNQWKTPEEKMTDVQLATQMVSDAYQNNYDMALLVSGDIDLVPAVEIVKAQPLNKRVIVAFPPMREADELRYAADGYLHIHESLLKNSQFASDIPLEGSYILRCPSRWR